MTTLALFDIILIETNQIINKGDSNMIVADKRYVDQKASMIPSPENFRTAVNDSLNFTYASYASWVNCEALQEECSDVAKLFKKTLSRK